MSHRWNISRMVARAVVAAAMVAAVTVVAGCGGESTVSRRYPCHFTFHTEWHPTSMIVTALNSYNYYVNIAMTTYRGAYVVNSSDAKGTKESITLSNELENLAYSGGIYLSRRCLRVDNRGTDKLQRHRGVGRTVPELCHGVYFELSAEMDR